MFAEGSGDSVAGALGVCDLTLTAPVPRGGDGVDGMWETAGVGYTGVANLNTTDAPGSALADGKLPLLLAVGDVCTIAVVYWFGARNATGDVLDAAYDESLGSETVIEIGESSEQAVQGFSIASPPAQPAENNTHVYSGSTPNGIDHFIEAPPYVPNSAAARPYLMLWQVEVVNILGVDRLRTRLWVDGIENGDPRSDWSGWAGPGVGLLRLMGATAYGSCRGAAVWDRALTGGERAELFGAGVLGADALLGIDAIGDEPPDTDLNDGDGAPLLILRLGVTRTEGAAVIASDGVHRHTRRIHERRVRRYTVELDKAEPAEVEKVLAAFGIGADADGYLGGASSRMGAGFVRWKCPDDTVVKRWRLVADSGITLTRTAGGRFGGATLTLEEV